MPSIDTNLLHAMQAKSVIDAALAYHEAGLCIIPLNGKRPALDSWKQYQSERPAQETIHAWHRDGVLRNIGVVCGAVSENLVVIDFDGPGGYPAFAATFPHLTETLMVATGGGIGRHIYLLVDHLPPTTTAKQTSIGSIELRSTGSYVVAPPSLHPRTGKPYEVEKAIDILRVPDLEVVVAWIEGFKPRSDVPREWQPPHHTPAGDVEINPWVISAIADVLSRRGAKLHGEWLNCSCIYPEHHAHGDQNPSFGFSTLTGYGHCYVCGTILAKDLCERLGINPQDHGGLVKPSAYALLIHPARSNPSVPPIATDLPDDSIPPVSDVTLPGLLGEYLAWASRAGNQTPLIFHQGAGIWMVAVAIARRVVVKAPWSIKVHPNLYMMFIAATTYYRKTTAYQLAHQVIEQAIPHLLLPTPGSPERFWDALAGLAPSNFRELPHDQQQVVLESIKFAAQRGLFKDEIAGLFGSLKRDYMAGLKDDLLRVYDCPTYDAKETQTGLRIIRNAALSILGVTTPAGLSSAISGVDWENGLLPRFALITPEPDYAERPAPQASEPPPALVSESLKMLYEALPMPEKSGDGWSAPMPLELEVTCWQECQDYSNSLRRLCNPHLETPLDDRLKGVYGRLHVQAMKIAMICATLDWLETGRTGLPVVTQSHWYTARTIAEHWRLSSHRLIEAISSSQIARREQQDEERLLDLFRQAGAEGLELRVAYRRLGMESRVARQIVQDMVRAGLLVEMRIGRAEAYVLAEHFQPVGASVTELTH